MNPRAFTLALLLSCAALAVACGGDTRPEATDPGTADATAGAALTVVSLALSEASGCDADGVLDAGEYGAVTVTLRNSGSVALAETTVTFSTTSSDVWFPDGPTVSFPSIAAGATSAATVRVAYLATVSGIQQLDFVASANDPALAAPVTGNGSFRANTDTIPASTATETVEAESPPWIAAFSATFGNIAPWQRTTVSALQHQWHVNDPSVGADQYLFAPVMTVDAGGTLNVQFDHSWSFEFDAGGNYDGGVVEVSINGGAYGDLDTSAYNGTILSYVGDVNPLKGRSAFVKSSGGTVHSSLTRAIAPGSSVQVRFRMATDSTGASSGWNVDNVAFTGILETPFSSLIADAHACDVVATSADVAIAVSDGTSSASQGGSVTYTITAANLSGDDLPSSTVTDAFPADLTCSWTCAGAGGATCTASGSGNLADHPALPVGGAAIYTASCTVSGSAASPLINTATIATPGPVTDPVPANNSATDTDTVTRLPAHLTASKTVAGSFVQGGTVTYTITVRNDGAGRQYDNPGNELSDVLPSGLALVSAAASSGAAVATLGTNTATWNGEIASSGSVTVTVVATVTAAAGSAVSNQATVWYDGDGDGTNESSAATDAYPCPAP